MSEATGPGYLDDLATQARLRAQARVAGLRARYPKEPRRLLADRLVAAFARRAGLGGAATGVLSVFSLPVGLPAGIALTLALEAELLLALMQLYDVETAGEVGRFKLYALWAGAGLADAAKSVGLKLGADALTTALAGTLPARLIAKLHPLLVRKVLQRLGLGWVPRLMKFWPVLGAPLGYVLDSSALRTLGDASIATLEAMPPRGTVPEGVVEVSDDS